MADIKDVRDTIASALTEVGVSGTLDVTMDGAESVVTVGEVHGEEVEVVVTVKPASEAAHPKSEA